jgi:hypothetical protein
MDRLNQNHDAQPNEDEIPWYDCEDYFREGEETVCVFCECGATDCVVDDAPDENALRELMERSE